jgi:tripartite-type tricarboxylate transporter receptor subunit TctC
MKVHFAYVLHRRILEGSNAILRCPMKPVFVALLALWSGLLPARAAEYPNHTITFVIPFAPGGPTDMLGRAIAEQMSHILGQPIVVENVAGAGGSVGVERVVHSPPDGYTICVGNWSTHVLNGAIYHLDYDLVADLEPVAVLPSAPQIIVARKDIKADNLSELIAWIKNNRATLGTAGVGSAGHVSAILFEQRIGAQLTLVHYRGGGPAMMDLIGGHIDLMIDQSTTSLPQVREHAIKAFAVTSAARLSSDPAIPTTEEAGLKDFKVAVWHGLWAPKDTPASIVAALGAAARQALSDPGMIKRLKALGQTIPQPDQISSASLRNLQQAEITKWWPILTAAHIKPE